LVTEVRSITANGVRFGYLEQGSGPLVLLVHGFPDTAHTWDAVMPALAATGYRVVAPFTRGYAPTEVALDDRYDVDTLGRDLLALIEALGERDAIVIGHDWGASAAYAAAALGPDQVRLLVAMAIPHPNGIKPTPKLVWSLRHFFALRGRGGANRILRDDCAYVDKLWRRWSPTWNNIPASETAEVKTALQAPGGARAAAAYYRDQGLPNQLPPSMKLPITVPTTAFVGTDDLAGPEVFEQSRSNFNSTYQVVTVPGGHFMHREHPAAFIKALLEVLGISQPGD
jgi:pimeloyl-ACP methyl ester carboxylesterase